MLHRQAERTGVVREILRGRVDRDCYALFLRNLLPAYQAMEIGLDRLRPGRGAGSLAWRELYRAPAIEADLNHFGGPAWPSSLSVLPIGDQYARRVAMASEGDGARLIAHAYTRFLGDLNGGQVLKRLLREALNLKDDGLAFYDFPHLADPRASGVRYRVAIDVAGTEIDDIAPVIEEAAVAFEFNIRLSEAVADVVAG
jgi:heme oxygenase